MTSAPPTTNILIWILCHYRDPEHFIFEIISRSLRDFWQFRDGQLSDEGIPPESRTVFEDWIANSERVERSEIETYTSSRNLAQKAISDAIAVADKNQRQFLKLLWENTWHCDSPIEELVLIKLIERSFFHSSFDMTFYGNADFDQDHHTRDHHVKIYQQANIGQYRADFLIHDCSLPLSVQKPRLMVVECDGHDFHEKTKDQAEHDKKRDRFFQSQGIKVLRFTGREIWQSPDEVAAEIINELAWNDAARMAGGETPRTFDVARDLEENVQPASISPEHVEMMRGQTPAFGEQVTDHVARQQPNATLQALSTRTIRDQERLYRARLAMRLGLADADIRAVFDLSADELAGLRTEAARA